MPPDHRFPTANLNKSRHFGIYLHDDGFLCTVKCHRCDQVWTAATKDLDHDLYDHHSDVHA